MTTVSGAPRSRGAATGLGVLIALTGLVLLMWPAATTLVVVRLLGLAVAFYGVHELIIAFGDDARSRLWSGILGVIAILGGFAIFLSPMVSSMAVGVVIGLYWLVGGAVGIAAAIMVPGHRIIRAFVAVISLVAGMIVVAQPGLSVVTLVWFSGLWMIVAGIVMIAGALFGQRQAVATI